MEREKKIIKAMLVLYCQDHHIPTADQLCSGCRDLMAYAYQRLDKCPFGSEKPTCAKCPIHCYEPDKREQIRQVMRYAGPRMLHKHPVLGLKHLIDGLKKVPPQFKKKA